MPSVRLSKNDRESLLTKLRDGHDVDSAGAALGLSEGEIKLFKDRYGPDIDTAFATGTSRLRARIMESALSNDNTATLLKMLEQRERDIDHADPISLVQRIITYARCENCGHTPGLAVEKPQADKEPSTETDDTLVQGEV